MKIRCASRRGVMYTKSGSRESSPADNCFQESKKKRLRIPDRFTLSGLLAPDRDRDLMKRPPFFSRILLPNGNASSRLSGD